MDILADLLNLASSPRQTGMSPLLKAKEEQLKLLKQYEAGLNSAFENQNKLYPKRKKRIRGPKPRKLRCTKPNRVPTSDSTLKIKP